MLKKIQTIYRILFSLSSTFNQQKKELVEHKILTAKTLINSFNYNILEPINNYEFKVFSQWGDDGIIQYLINVIDIPNKTFIEFGVEDYTEANTRFLLINNNWRGLIIDGSQNNIDQVKNSDIYWKYDITAIAEFITTENINSLFIENGFKDEIGILSIDIDGNDYWVLKAINSISPIILVVEYNSVFGATQPWTIPYQPDFVRSKAHFSNLYYGCSLQSLYDLAKEKGYKFIGCNDAGNNAYFIRNDKIGGLKPLNCQQGYVESKFKESRNENGDLSLLKYQNRLNALKGKKIYNTRLNLLEKI